MKINPQAISNILFFFRNVGRWIRYSKIFIWVLSFIGGITLLHLLFFGFVYFGAFGKLASKGELGGVQRPVATEVYTSDGVLMGKYYIQNREDLKPKELTPFLLKALLVTEDVRFFHHKGIDYRSLGRVAIKTILMGDESAGGGSTITQQLAKNLYPRQDHGFLSLPVNKIKEMILARRIEKIYSKKEILELYLNTVPFSENTYGIKSATRRYFNKSPDLLKPEESALLVGMLKATYLYNPNVNYERALNRRNTVLQQMIKYEALEAEKGDSLQNLPIKLDYNPMPHYAGIAPYFREFLRHKLEKTDYELIKNGIESYNIYTDGLRVYTTLDSRLQNYAEETVREHMAHLQHILENTWHGEKIWENFPHVEEKLRKTYSSDSARQMEVFTWDGLKEKKFSSLDSIKHYLGFLQAGLLSMEVKTGAIKAWVGGIDYEYFKYDHVLSKRQAGSTFKPFIYLAAIKQGIYPCDFFPNDSFTYALFDNWNPRNAHRSYKGFYSVKGALAHSVNTVSVDLLMKTGIDKVRMLAKQCGIESELPEVPSLALGTANVSLLEMVNAYQTLANKGKAVDHFFVERIEDRRGNVLYEAPSLKPERIVVKEEYAEIMIDMLRNVVRHGTAGEIRYKYNLYHDLAGKTGTTQNYADGWFIGFSPSLVTGVWVGGELQNIRFRTMKYGQGSRTAMPIWANYMSRVYSDENFTNLKEEEFEISPYTKTLMSCENFYEEDPFDSVPRKNPEWGVKEENADKLNLQSNIR